MNRPESPVVFPCAGERLVGVLHTGSPEAEIGVIIVVGGPQYRVGAHRSFVNIARRIAAAGNPVLRFDARGMGDSTGDWPGFDHTGPDINAALDFLFERIPSLQGVVLAGLCDGASASLMYAPGDERVAGLILLNPWIRSADGPNDLPLRHYYLPRLREIVRRKRVLREQIDIGAWIRESAWSGRRLLSSVLRAVTGGGKKTGGLAFRMASSLESFHRPVLVLISGEDMVGREFEEHWKSYSKRRRGQRNDGSEIKVFAGARHTLPSRRDLEAAAAECVSWLTGRFARP